MLKNEKKLFDKLIRIMLLALFCSFLSALYISAVETDDIAPNAISSLCTQVGNFETPGECD